MWQRIFWWARLAAAAWAGIVAILTALHAIGWVTIGPALTAVAWVVSLFIIAADNVGTLISRRLTGSRTEREQALSDNALTLIHRLARGSRRALGSGDIGVSVYVPEPQTRRQRTKGAPVKFKRLLRCRPGEYPQQSGISWNADVGTLGKCWRSQRPEYSDWYAVAQRFSGREVDENEFEGLEPDVRQGFDIVGFNSIAGKYAEVHAEPIWHLDEQRTLIGVMTVDRVFDAEDDAYMPQLSGSTARQEFAASASVVSRILKPKRRSD